MAKFFKNTVKYAKQGCASYCPPDFAFPHPLPGKQRRFWGDRVPYYFFQYVGRISDIRPKSSFESDDFGSKVIGNVRK